MAKRKKPDRQLIPVPKGKDRLATPRQLLDDLRSLIRQTREGVAQAVNSALVLLHWEVGRRIRTEILKHKPATHGNEISSILSNPLQVELGNGFSRPNLTRRIRATSRGAMAGTTTPRLAFPFLKADDLVRFLALRSTHDENEVIRDFRAWVQQQITPGPTP